MRKLAALLVCYVALPIAAAQSAQPPSFSEAGAKARAALPKYVLVSCERGKGPIVRCDMMRDARGWRLVRTVAVPNSGKPRATRARKLCRLAPAKRDRCAFRLPPR